MYLIFRSKDEWSWAGNETWIRRKGRVTAMASSNCGLFEILVILGTKLVFYRDSSLCRGDVMRFTRLHKEPLVRGHREAGPSTGCTCMVCNVPTLAGLWFLVPLVEPPTAHWLHDWKLLALIHLRRCWCLLTGASCTQWPLSWAGHSQEDWDREQGEDQLPSVSLTFSNQLCSE